jgi:hypothetical protein
VSCAGKKVSVSRLGGNRAGEMRLRRFLENPSVDVEEMVASAAVRTSVATADRHVLAIQDTTSVRSDPLGGGGLSLHAMIAVDAADGALLGLIEARYLERGQGRRDRRKATAYADKESRRWQEAAQAAALICGGARRLTVIADRESDVYEAFALAPEGVEMLVRSAQDRSLDDDGRLFATIDALPEAARQLLALPARGGRKPRETMMAVRLARVDLARPRTRRASEGLPKSVSVTVVDVREVDPPASETPLHWRLITTCPVSNAEDAFAVAQLYRRRWAIEQLFRAMKTQGFDIEALRQAQDLHRQKLVTLLLIAAVIVQQLVHARDLVPGCAPRPILDAFMPEDIPLLESCCAELEGKTERQKNPHPRRSLQYASWVCARLGGWTGYYGKPGPIVMLRGWQQFQDIKLGWTMANIQAAIRDL